MALDGFKVTITGNEHTTDIRDGLYDTDYDFYINDNNEVVVYGLSSDHADALREGLAEQGIQTWKGYGR